MPSAPAWAGLPASVEKLWTTSTALLAFGPSARLSTSVLADGRLQGGTFHGTLYLRGGGDPTFGSSGFDRLNYGTGATVQALVSSLIRTLGLRALDGVDRRRRLVLRRPPGNPGHRVPGQPRGRGIAVGAGLQP